MLDFIFRRNNPTNAWIREPNLNLVADLGSITLNGVAVGSSIERVAFLGRSDGNGESSLDYGELGLSVEVGVGSCFSGFTLFFADEEKQFRSYAGELKIGGETVSLVNLVDSLGEPYWTDTDENETLHFFEFPSHEIQCELTRGNVLKAVVVTTNPLMADPEQREAYGVNKPWPA